MGHVTRDTWNGCMQQPRPQLETMVKKEDVSALPTADNRTAPVHSNRPGAPRDSRVQQRQQKQQNGREDY